MTNQVNVNLMKRRRKSKDIGIGGFAARWYDNNTRRHRLAEMKAYAKDVAGHIQDGATVLEVAPGPGYLAIELAKMGSFEIIGLELSKDFVDIAQRNALKANVTVEFRQGNAASIPFPENTFDFVVCTAAFKNFREPLKALTEMHRVLKPGGTALIVDMNRNATDRQIEDYTENMGVSGMDKFLTKLIFKHFLRKGAYSIEEFVDMVSKTAFREHRIREEAIGFHAYLVK
jgi:ubiquinone/menaquinone biosynthesis C-methylase UbiE